jgi:large subunit ribosomal protein L6
MSRLASKPILIPNGITCALENGVIKITKSGKSTSFSFNSNYISATIIDNSSVLFSRKQEVKTPVELKGLLGTTWALFKLAIKDINEGSQAKLNFVGVGYKASVVKAGQFSYLKIIVGFSHPIFIFIPEGISIIVDKTGAAIITGNNTNAVSTFASKVRSQKKPTPYHGTGVIVNDEIIIKKAGKKK